MSTAAPLPTFLAVDDISPTLQVASCKPLASSHDRQVSSEGGLASNLISASRAAFGVSPK